MPSNFDVLMATAVSTSAWAKDVKAGLPSSQARITLFKRGSSAICLSPARKASSKLAAEHRKQPAPHAIGILEHGCTPVSSPGLTGRSSTPCARDDVGACPMRWLLHPPGEPCAEHHPKQA